MESPSPGWLRVPLPPRCFGDIPGVPKCHLRAKRCQQLHPWGLSVTGVLGHPWGGGSGCGPSTAPSPRVPLSLPEGVSGVGAPSTHGCPPRATSRNLPLLLSPEIDEDRLPNPLLKVGAATRSPPAPQGAPQHPGVPPTTLSPPLLSPTSACFAVGSGHVPQAEEEGVPHHPHHERYLGGVTVPWGSQGTRGWPGCVPLRCHHLGDMGTRGHRNGGAHSSPHRRGHLAAPPRCHGDRGVPAAGNTTIGDTRGGLGDAAVPSAVPLAALQSCR